MWTEEECEQIEGLTREEKKKFASESMKVFFNQHRIPRSVLFNKKNVEMVVDTPLIEAVQRVHSVLPDEVTDKRRSFKRDHLPESTEKIIQVMNNCAKLYIPKTFAPGIMLLYFRFCEGFEIE